MPAPHRLRLAAAAAALALPAAASAQACLGFPSFGAFHARGGAAVGFGNGQTTFGPNVAFGGGPTGGFGGLNAGIISFNGGGGTGFNFGAQGGLQIPVGDAATRSAVRLQVCPVADVNFALGPSSEGSSRPNALALDGGLAVGASFAVAPGVAFVPFSSFTGGYVRQSQGGESDGKAGATLTFGTGLTFAERFTPQVAVGIPFGFGGGNDPNVSIGLGISFGPGGESAPAPRRTPRR